MAFDDLFGQGAVDRFKDQLNDIYPVSRETFRRLQKFGQKLAEWQQRTNLVAPGTLEHFWTRHVADSLQCLAVAGTARRWADLGSGGGFPGMVIAIAAAEAGENENILIESNRKKCAFLRAVAMASDTRVHVVCERIELAAPQIAINPGAIEAVTARALAPLPKLLELAAPLLTTGSTGYFHKGRDYLTEIEVSRGLWQFDLVVHESRIAADSVLLEIRNLNVRR